MRNKKIEFNNQQLSLIVNSLGNAIFGDRAIDDATFSKVIGANKQDAIKLLSYINDNLKPITSHQKLLNIKTEKRINKEVVKKDNTEDQENDRTSIRYTGDYGSEHNSSNSEVKVVNAIGRMDLERKMKKYIAQGYVPQGSPTFVNRGKNPFLGITVVEYTQVMVKH